METRHQFSGKQINDRFQTKFSAVEMGKAALSADIKTSVITFNGETLSNEARAIPGELSFPRLESLLLGKFGGKDNTGKVTGKADVYNIMTSHLSAPATLRDAYALFDIEDEDVVYSSNIYRDPAKDNKIYYRITGTHKEGRGQIEAIYSLTPKEGYVLDSYSVDGKIADEFKIYVETGVKPTIQNLSKTTSIESDISKRVVEDYSSFPAKLLPKSDVFTIPKSGPALAQVIIDYLGKPDSTQKALNGLIDQLPKDTNPSHLAAILVEYLRCSNDNAETAYNIIKKFPKNTLDTIKANVEVWLPADMEPNEFEIVNKKIQTLLNDLPNKGRLSKNLSTFEIHETLNFIRNQFVKKISKLPTKAPSSPGSIKVTFGSSPPSPDASSLLLKPVTILREGDELAEPFIPAVTRAAARDEVNEVIIPPDEFNEACINVFLAVQQAKKDNNFENPVNAVIDLSDRIAAYKMTHQHQNETEVEKAIIEKIKAQIIQSLTDLKDKGARRQLNAISNLLLFSVDNEFDETSEEKAAFDLYQEALKEVIATHVINHFKDKEKHAKFDKTKHLMREISSYLADFFNELKIININDAMKSTILYEFLEAAMLEDYTKVLDYPTEFQSHSFKSALTHIQNHLNTLQQFSIEKKIAAQEKETFYKTVTLHLLEKTCKKYLTELAEKGDQASKSYERVNRFYNMVLRHIEAEFDTSHPEELKDRIEIFKRQASHEGTAEADADFIARIEEIAALKPERQYNHLHALLLKLSSLEMVNITGSKNNLSLTFPWGSVDDTENLKTILSDTKVKYGSITAEKFLAALDDNENRPANERILLSDACINTFSEYLKYMEELEAFAKKILPAIGISNSTLLFSALSSVLSRLDENFLNTVAVKIGGCIEINRRFNIDNPDFNYLISDINRVISEINLRRQTDVSRQELISIINKENQTNQSERDAAYALSHKNYITTKPAYWTLLEQRTWVHRHKTVNDLIHTCETFKKVLEDEALDDLNKPFNELINTVRTVRSQADAPDFLAWVTKDRFSAQILQKILENSTKEPFAAWLEKNKGAVQKCIAIQARVEIINHLQVILEEEDVPHYKKLLAFEAELANSKDVLLKINSDSHTITRFIGAVERKQDSNVVLHHACNVFQQEMSDKVNNILSTDKNKNTYNHFKQMAEAANESSIIPSMVRTYNARENRNFRYLVNQNDELLTTLKKYQAVTDIKKELTAYESRPQKALKEFKKKLTKHEAVLKKDEDGPVTKFFLTVARVLFGYTPKKTPVEGFYTTTKNTLFVKPLHLPASKSASFEDKFRKHKK